jgi:MraZ protein
MAEQRTRFVGTYEHGLDDKGRMVLPSKIRALLGETGMVAELDGCLGLFTLEGFDEISDTLAAKVEAHEAPMQALREFMAFAAEVTPDQQGRVVIPQRLRDRVRLGSEVVVNGRRNRAEIWDKRVWDEMTAPRSDDAGPDDQVSTTIAALRL